MANSHGRFVWYELMTTDMEGARAFYRKVVGWGTEDASMPGMAYSLFTAKGISVSGLMELPEAAEQIGERPSWIGYVGVDDVDTAADRTRRLSGIVHVPPRNMADISRFSLVADPQMATFALLQWLKPRREQPAELNAPGRVRWHELLTVDSENAFPFYGEIFGWQKGEADIDETGVYLSFSANGQTIGGICTKPSSVSVPFWLFYFNVGDVDAAAKRVKAAGGEIIDGPRHVWGSEWAVQSIDPQGAMFALVGERSRSPIGYFERDAAGGQPDGGKRRWSW